MIIDIEDDELKGFQEQEQQVTRFRSFGKKRWRDEFVKKGI